MFYVILVSEYRKYPKRVKVYAQRANPVIGHDEFLIWTADRGWEWVTASLYMPADETLD